jgi:hypothetical protein
MAWWPATLHNPAFSGVNQTQIKYHQTDLISSTLFDFDQYGERLTNRRPTLAQQILTSLAVSVPTNHWNIAPATFLETLFRLTLLTPMDFIRFFADHIIDAFINFFAELPT